MTSGRQMTERDPRTASRDEPAKTPRAPVRGSRARSIELCYLWICRSTARRTHRHPLLRPIHSGGGLGVSAVRRRAVSRVQLSAADRNRARFDSDQRFDDLAKACAKLQCRPRQYGVPEVREGVGSRCRLSRYSPASLSRSVVRPPHESPARGARFATRASVRTKRNAPRSQATLEGPPERVRS